MHPVIVFTSQTGFTRRYAEYIANRLDCPLVNLADNPRFDPEGYDAVVFCGWFHAASLKGFRSKPLRYCYRYTPVTS